MSTTWRSNGNRRDIKCKSIHLLGLLIVINCATAIDYAAYRKDTLPRGPSRQTALTTRNILEELNLRKETSNVTLQDATEHLLRYGALLRAQILDTFGKLVYDHYDDFSMSQIEALYRIYRETLEREYNIFDIVPSVLEDPDTRPTKICAHINEHVSTCLKESTNVCMSVKIHNEPYDDVLAKPALNVTRRIYRLGEITSNYPNGFSLKAVVRHLRAGHLRFTPTLLSGLLLNVQYDNFDDKVRTAERELVTYLGKSLGPLIAKKLEKSFISGRTIGELLKLNLAKGEKLFRGRAANQAAYLSRHVVREINAISENIELLGAVYDNSTINLKYLFELILPNDTIDRDVLEARNYLLRQMETKKIIEKYLTIEKYQQFGPDQLLMEILGQLRDIRFAEDIVTSLYTHARFWHKSHMIENLNELIELFDAYENLRGAKVYEELMGIIDDVKSNLRDSKNITIELLCSRPRDCLRTGLETVANCAIINDEIKRAIELFVHRTSCGCSCLMEDSSSEMTTSENNENFDTTEESVRETRENSVATRPVDSKDYVSYSETNETEKSEAKNIEETVDPTVTEITEIPITTVALESLETNDSSSTEETREESTKESCEHDCSSNNCNHTSCSSETTEEDCPDCETSVTEISCTGPDCSTNSVEKLVGNSTKISCVGPDCSMISCENGSCDSETSESEHCEGSDCSSGSCEGEDCEESSTQVNGSCEGPNCPELVDELILTDTTEKAGLNCEGDDCPGESLKTDCKDGDCSDSRKLVNELTVDCNGTDCPNCTGDRCPVNETSQECKGPGCQRDPLLSSVNTTECQDSDCSTEKREKSCDGPECSSDTSEREETCEGSDCSESSGVKSDCEGSDCSERTDETKEEDCEGSGCSESKDETREEDCEGSDCSGSIDAAKEEDCQGNDCPISLEIIKEDCEGSNCTSELPVMTSTSCSGENCSDSEEICIGELCATNPPTTTLEIEQTEESTNPSFFIPIESESLRPTSPVISCDNSDPHYQRKLDRLRKMRLVDALFSKPRSSHEIFNNLHTSSVEKETKTSENTNLRGNVSEKTSSRTEIFESTNLRGNASEETSLGTKVSEGSNLKINDAEKISFSANNFENSIRNVENLVKKPLIQVLGNVGIASRSAVSAANEQVQRKIRKYYASHPYESKNRLKQLSKIISHRGRVVSRKIKKSPKDLNGSFGNRTSKVSIRESTVTRPRAPNEGLEFTRSVYNLKSMPKIYQTGRYKLREHSITRAPTGKRKYQHSRLSLMKGHKLGRYRHEKHITGTPSRDNKNQHSIIHFTRGSHSGGGYEKLHL